MKKAASPPRDLRSRWWPLWLGFGAAIGAAFIVYAPGLNGAFVFDDITLPFATPYRPFRDWLGVRPLLMISYWLNYQLSGQETFTYHAANVLLHITNAILVFFIVRKILDFAGVDSSRWNVLAGFAGAIFLLHPVQTEAVTYIAGRSETLSVVLFFGAFAVFLYRDAVAVSWPVSILVLLLFAAAMNTKEHTAVLPAALLLTDFYWNPPFSFEGIRRNWRLYVPTIVALLAGISFLLRYLLAAGSIGFRIKDLPWYSYFFTECRAFFVYSRLFLFPVGQNVDYDFPISRTILDHGAVVALIAIAILIALAIFYRREYKLASYGLFLALILFAPTSSVIPIADPVAERRLYLPMIGLLLIVVEIIRRVQWTPRIRIAVLSSICLAAAILTYHRNGVWTSAIALEEDAMAKSPGNKRVREVLAGAYFREGRCGDAVRQYSAASAMETPSYRLYLNWGVALECDGQLEAALDLLRKAAAMQATAHVYASMGKVQADQRKWAESMASLQTAARIDPRFPWTYVYRGSVYQTLGDLDAAASDYRLALEFDPHNFNARELLTRLEANLKSR